MTQTLTFSPDSIPNPAGRIAPSRQARLLAELRHAWARTPLPLLKAWARDLARMLMQVTLRRGRNLLHLAWSVASTTANEVGEAAAAYRHDRLAEHVRHRAEAARDASSALWQKALTQVVGLVRALRSHPGDTAPELIVATLAFLGASGGLDGNGGIPDLDLATGIGAHRSLLAHSILSGAVIESLLYGVATLVGLVHDHLPADHDPLWDNIRKNKDRYLKAAAGGASAGIAYHLFIDGSLQGGVDHGLPMPLPADGHELFVLANAKVEMLDAFKKESTFAATDRTVSGAVSSASPAAGK